MSILGFGTLLKGKGCSHGSSTSTFCFFCVGDISGFGTRNPDMFWSPTEDPERERGGGEEEGEREGGAVWDLPLE